MGQSRAWTKFWLLGLLLEQTIMPSTLAAPDREKREKELCKAVNVVNSSLDLKERMHYMRHNLPINFTIKVHYEEIFKLRNVSRLERKLKPEDLQDVDLQDTWLRVNLGVLKKIKSVLPKKHPSFNYTSDLETLLLNVEQVFDEMVDRERETPERIQKIWEELASPLGKRWTEATPKSLMDNCYQTMHCVFKCFSSSANYCERSYWRDVVKAQHQRLLQK